MLDINLTGAWRVARRVIPHMIAARRGVIINNGLAMLEGQTPEQIAERSAGNLLDMPWIEPEDVAEAVVFLASSRARSITGSAFVLDAGLLTR